MDDLDDWDDRSWPLDSWQWDVIGVAVGIVIAALAGIAVAILV